MFYHVILQAYVLQQKLPNNLQTKWRETVVKCRIKNGRIVGFEDLSKFVEFAAESANDPIYSKDALANTRVRAALPSGIADHYKKVQTPKPKCTSFATNIDASTQSLLYMGPGALVGKLLYPTPRRLRSL